MFKVNMIKQHQIIVADINECITNNSCKNGSTCVNDIGGYLCLCVPGLTGVHCDQGKDVSYDKLSSLCSDEG